MNQTSVDESLLLLNIKLRNINQISLLFGGDINPIQLYGIYRHESLVDSLSVLHTITHPCTIIRSVILQFYSCYYS